MKEFLTRLCIFGVNRSSPGTSKSKVSLSLAKAIDDFLKFKTAEGLSQRTITSYEFTLGHWLKYIGDREVSEIQSSDLTGYMAWLLTSLMSSIVVINDEGSVLYQNVVEDVQDLVKIIRDGRNVPGYALDDCPEVQVNGLIVLAGQQPKPKRKAPALSERQISVLQLLARAYSPDQITLKLGLTKATIRLHIRALKKKCGTDSRDQMMAMAGQLGLCDPFETSTVHDQTEDQTLSR